MTGCSEASSTIEGISKEDSVIELLDSGFSEDEEAMDGCSVGMTTRVLVITVGDTSSIEDKIVLVPLNSVMKCVSVVCVE